MYNIEQIQCPKCNGTGAIVDMTTPPTDEGVLRDQLAVELNRFAVATSNGEMIPSYTEADSIIAILADSREEWAKANGYVKLDKDQMLPRNDRDVHIWRDYTSDMAYEAGQQDMIKAGWRKT